MLHQCLLNDQKERVKDWVILLGLKKEVIPCKAAFFCLFLVSNYAIFVTCVMLTEHMRTHNGRMHTEGA